MLNIKDKQQKTKPNISIAQLEKRIPPVSDKALVDLVNGIQVSQNILTYRKNRGFLGQLFDRLAQSDRQRQLLIDGNLIAGQQTLHNWVLELTDSLRISQLGLRITQKSLLETRNAVRVNKFQLRQNKQDLADLDRQLDRLAQSVNYKLKTVEAKIHQLETKVSANEDLDRIISAWEANQTYVDLSWLIQIIFLIQEIFSSSVITYELETQDLNKYRSLVVNKILARSVAISQNFFSLAELLNFSTKQLNREDLPLCAAILEIRSIPLSRLNNTPLLFSLGTTLEFAQLPPEAHHKQPGKSALKRLS